MEQPAGLCCLCWWEKQTNYCQENESFPLKFWQIFNKQTNKKKPNAEMIQRQRKDPNIFQPTSVFFSGKWKQDFITTMRKYSQKFSFRFFPSFFFFWLFLLFFFLFSIIYFYFTVWPSRMETVESHSVKSILRSICLGILAAPVKEKYWTSFAFEFALFF